MQGGDKLWTDHLAGWVVVLNENGNFHYLQDFIEVAEEVRFLQWEKTRHGYRDGVRAGFLQVTGALSSLSG